MANKRTNQLALSVNTMLETYPKGSEYYAWIKTLGEKVKHSTQVYTTTDYSLFKPIEGNRDLNLLHLNRLKESMGQQYVFTIITVNEKHEIIDGSHRFYTIKELKLPLHYVVCPGYGLREVHILNANSKTWTTDDYLNGYCNMDNNHYLVYRDFKNKYGFGHNESITMLGHFASNGDAIKHFWMGKFKVKNLNEAERIAKQIYMIKPFYDGYKRKSFVFAILKLLKNNDFSFSEFLIKLKNQPTALQDCINVEGYVTLIEEIYNWRRREKVNLRYK